MLSSLLNTSRNREKNKKPGSLRRISSHDAPLLEVDERTRLLPPPRRGPTLSRSTTGSNQNYGRGQNYVTENDNPLILEDEDGQQQPVPLLPIFSALHLGSETQYLCVTRG